MERPNLSYIDTLSGGDDVFKNKLITIIKTEFPDEKAVYLKNIEAKKFKEASENVHKLKHKISILGLEKSYAIAADFENNLKKNKAAGKEDFDNILQVITNFLNTL
ncbi:histidine kinase [Jejuia spongiicola]|uniref:Hpt domain-containing protein n=1 Tax=Jejuia spongiicola TaxID=2942207 RepID=A0ABT0QAM9_9FLAO|nr:MULTISPECIES: histidine kinase [Flavobacteriaceae]MCL6293949.1 Hpt domain-containing protein [Jejuia spongiicola]PIA78521.1 histidine kinase [Gaetbulibacter sp. 4G1]